MDASTLTSILRRRPQQPGDGLTTAAPALRPGQPTLLPAPTTATATPISDAVMTVVQRAAGGGGGAGAPSLVAGQCVLRGGETGRMAKTVLYHDDGTPATVTICLSPKADHTNGTTTIPARPINGLEKLLYFCLWGGVTIFMIGSVCIVVIAVLESGCIEKTHEAVLNGLLRLLDLVHWPR